LQGRDPFFAVRFNLEARKASDEAKHEEYSAKFAASIRSRV